MSDRLRLAQRVRRLAAFLHDGEALSVSICRGEDEITVVRNARAAAKPSAGNDPAGADAQTRRVDTITAELVGVFRLSRPVPVEGEVLSGPRELGYIEALGIRNPVHSFGGGRIVTIASNDGAPVEYGQPLFLVDRG